MRVAVLALSLVASSPAFALSVPTGPYAGPALQAAKRGDCEAAVGLLNKGIDAKDGEALFWIGRMLDLGTCVAADPERATKFFSAADKAGNNDAKLELATKYGLGVGVEQSYERAGELARASGGRPQEGANTYSVGYANTIRGVAQRKIVESLPSDLLRQSFSGEILIEFSPRTQQVKVRPGPQFAMRSDPPTGSSLRRARTDIVRVAEDVWRDAMSKVPVPENALLEDRPVTLGLEVDVKLEPIDPESLTPLILTRPTTRLGGAGM